MVNSGVFSLQTNNGLMNDLFGPIHPRWCNYFYILAILFFISLALTLLSFLFAIVKNPKAIANMNFWALIISQFLAYMLYRLLHTMCVKTL
jgi:hypothetical protein